jgi:hypothetical protein
MATKKSTRSNQAQIKAAKNIKQNLRAKAQDDALAKKALVADQAEGELYSDDITGAVYKAYPVVLTEADFTKSANTASAETTIMSKQVPNGVEYLFRAPKSNLDRNSPYLYGTVLDKTTTTVKLSAGSFRIKVMDASQNNLKGQPFTGAVSQVDNADAIDWNKRLFFNCRSPIRAKAGDYVLITLNSSALWDVTDSAITIQCLELVVQ